MNSMYVMSGRGQSTLQGASWAPTRAPDATDGNPSENTNAISAAADSDKNTRLAERAHNRGPDVMEAKLSFDDLVDIINPLQHIPVLNLAYRAITGDKISGFAKIAGGALYGGGLGLVGGAIDAIVEQETGKDTGEIMVAALTGESLRKDRDAIPAHAPAESIGDSHGEVMVAQNNTEEAPDDVAVADASDETATETQVASAMPAPALPVSSQPLQAAAPARQPFGGILDTQIAAAAKASAPNVHTAAPAQVAANDDDAPMVAEAGAGNLVGGQKFYSLASAPRLGDGHPLRMPIKDSPDVRLKPIFAQGYAPGAKAASAAAAQEQAQSVAGIPLVSKDQAARVLNLDNDGADVAAIAPAAGEWSTKNSDKIPQQLIEDMMKSALDKYQKGLSNGHYQPAPTVDING